MIKKKTLRRASTKNLIRLAKWLKIDYQNLKHYDLVDIIYITVMFK